MGTLQDSTRSFGTLQLPWLRCFQGETLIPLLALLGLGVVILISKRRKVWWNCTHLTAGSNPSSLRQRFNMVQSNYRCLPRPLGWGRNNHERLETGLLIHRFPR